MNVRSFTFTPALSVSHTSKVSDGTQRKEIVLTSQL
jgi:hypothetical protein